MKNITKGKQIGIMIKPESFDREIYASESMVNKALEDYSLKEEVKYELSKKADKTELNKYVLKTTYEAKIKSLEENISKLEVNINELENKLSELEESISKLEDKLSELEEKEE